MGGGESEFTVVELPSSFNYFGKEFSKLHIYENGFITLSNSNIPAWQDANLVCLRQHYAHTPPSGGTSLMYFDDSKHFYEGANNTIYDSPYFNCNQKRIWNAGKYL